MKLVFNLIKIFIFILALFILTQNSGEVVQFKFFTLTYPAASLLVVILLAFALGAFTGAIFMAFMVIQAQSEKRMLQTKNRQLMTELENLRNISIEEVPDEDLTDSPETPLPENPLKESIQNDQKLSKVE